MNGFDSDLYMRWNDFKGYLMHELKFPVKYKSHIGVIPYGYNETALTIPKIPMEEFEVFLRDSLILTDREVAEIISINSDTRYRHNSVFDIPLKYICRILTVKTGRRIVDMDCSTYGAQLKEF